MCLGADNDTVTCDKASLSSSCVDPVIEVEKQSLSSNDYPGPFIVSKPFNVCLEPLNSFQKESSLDAPLALASPINFTSFSFTQPSIPPNIIQTELINSLVIPTNTPQHQYSRDQGILGHPKAISAVTAIRNLAILQSFNADKAIFQNDSVIFEPNQTNPVSLVLPLNSKVDLSSAAKSTQISVCPLLKEKGLDLSMDLISISCVNQSMAKNSWEITSLSEEEDWQSSPPGFNFPMEKSSEESSIETAIHVSEETSSSEEEVNGFTSSRARLVQEKLGITVLGLGNADKAFAEFCRNRQKEIENIRKKSVVPDVTINLRNHVGKKRYHTRWIVEGGKKKFSS